MFGTLLLTLLMEGFITISVEVLTIRQLTPFYGSSIIVTSLIIGIFLLFLALGYWRGGSYTQHFFKRLSQNFIFSIIWIGIGLSYIFISLFFVWTESYFSFFTSLTSYLLIVLAPVVYWLGQTIPLTTNLFNQQHRMSRISGYSLFLSTMGSFLGALITSLIFFQYLGVAWVVVINCLLLYILIIHLKPYSHITWLSVLLLGCILCFIAAANIKIEKSIFNLTNNYGNYRVTQTKNQTRKLEINLSSSSQLTTKNEGYPYIEFIRNILFKQFNLNNKEILVIGAGGFTLTADGTHDNRVTYVDIDPNIQSLSEKYFLKQKINGQFIGQDARHYLYHTAKQYDVIVSDAYSNTTAIPPALLTTDYFQQLANHLTDSGVLMVNVVCNPLFNDPFSKRVNNTIHQVFNFCTIIPLHWKKHSNIIYICYKQNHDEKIYTDNLTTATTDFFSSRQT